VYVGCATLHVHGGTEVTHNMGKSQINLDTYDTNLRHISPLYADY
jgi:hypothetical protein